MPGGRPLGALTLGTGGHAAVGKRCLCHDRALPITGERTVVAERTERGPDLATPGEWDVPARVGIQRLPGIGDRSVELPHESQGHYARFEVRVAGLLRVGDPPGHEDHARWPVHGEKPERPVELDHDPELP